MLLLTSQDSKLEILCQKTRIFVACFLILVLSNVVNSFNEDAVPDRCKGCPVIEYGLFKYKELTRQVGLAALGEDGLNVGNSLSWVEKIEQQSWGLLTELVLVCETYSEVQPYGCRVPANETPIGLW